MFKLPKTFTALLLVLSICFSAVSTVFAVEEKEISAQEIAADSVVIYYNMNRMLNKGVQSSIDAAENGSMMINETVYAELSWLYEYFGITYKWNGEIQSIILNDGEDECSIVCGDFSDVEENSSKGFFLNEYTYIPVKSLCEKMGWHFYYGSEFWAMSKNTALDTVIDKAKEAEILTMGKTLMAEYDFEGEQPEYKMGLWDGASSGTFAMPCGVAEKDGNSYLQIGASLSGYGGLYLLPVNFEKDTNINIEFDAMASDDFANASFTFLIQAFRNGVFYQYIDGIYSTPAAGKWTHMTKALDSSKIPADATDIRLVFCSTNKAQNATGCLMFDNVKVVSNPVIKDNTVSPTIKSDKLGNWYILGETITMTPQNKIDEASYEKVVVEVYDSWNKLVNTETVSTKSFNNGYKWKPQKQGFYELQFYTIDYNGKLEELNDFQTMTNPNTKESVRIYLKRQGVVVARYETKPMEERSDRLAVSVESGRYLNPEIANGRKKGLQGDQLAIANLLGFSKIRLHWISPDGLNYKTQSKANVRRGDFDFAEWDLSVDEATDMGFDLVLNILGTPRYAVPYREGWTTPTGANINYYAPVNMEAWRAFVEYTVNRYQDVCNIWEIWNEPHIYGGSVFWKGITEDYSQMQKTAYEVVKKYQPGDESIVTIGGIGARRYTNFYEELVQTEGYEYFDALAMHGWDVDPWTYNKIAEDYGKEAKPICSTELHMMLRASDSEYLNNTEKEEAMRMVVEFLKDFKYGSIFTTFFAVNVQHNVEWLKYLNENKIYGQGMDGGAYKVGISQPRFAAIAMNTFFDTMGKQYDYVDEYLLANKKQNVVRVNSNGEDQLIVWDVGGSKGIKTLLPKQITDAARDDFRIIDWENNDIDTSDLDNIEIDTETMYFISGLDGSKLDLIESAQGEELYTGGVLYNITEKAKTDTSNIMNHVITNGGTRPLFDKTTFEEINDITYTDTNWKWTANTFDAQQGDFNAKFAASVADDGMYLIVKVNDSVDNATAEPSQMNQKDSIQFAFDTVGDRSDNGYMECYAGLDLDGKPTVYKKTAPYIGGDMISDFTEGENIIEKAVVSRTVNGSEITYMVYLPNSEIYPYERNINEALHFSVLVNQNDTNSNTGYLEWGAGLGKEKNPKKFGDIWLDAEAAKSNNIYYPHLGIGSNAALFDLETLEYSDNINWISDNINWVSLTGEDESFKAKFAVGVTDEGVYIAAEVDDAEANMEAKSNTSLWSKDSMQFAIDLGLKGSSADRIECQFGKVEGAGDVLYKESAPFITAEKAPAQYTQAKNAIQNGVRNVTVLEGKIIYKLFMPADEIYPFNISENDIIKLSVLFNQNTGGERIGYLEWNSGIGGAKDCKQYGIISYK